MRRGRFADEATARYLLPVNMLEKLVTLRKKFPKKGMTFCLHDGVLTIAIHYVDFFESRGLKKLDIDGVRHTYEEINTIIEMINLMNLNTRIWSKQDKDFIANP